MSPAMSTHALIAAPVGGSILPALPEITLAAAACVVLMADVYVPRRGAA